MTKDDILLALRLTAMGRAGHPLQEELAERLAKLFAKDACEFCVMPGGKHHEPCPNNVTFPTAADPIQESEVQPPKRTRKKAE